MYPHERSLVKNLQDKPFALIGVNSDKNLDEVREIVKQKNITWRSFWNGPDGTGGPISTEWDVSGWPTLYVIDAQGIIRHKQLGGSKKCIDNAITSLLAEMGHEVDISSFEPIAAPDPNASGEPEEGSGETDGQ